MNIRLINYTHKLIKPDLKKLAEKKICPKPLQTIPKEVHPLGKTTFMISLIKAAPG